MLQEASDHAFDLDVLRQPRNPRPEAADPSYNETDLDSGSRGSVQRVDDLAVYDCVELGPDGRRAAGLSMFDFVFDEGASTNLAKWSGRPYPVV
jgi:hypothetical protein